MPQLVQDGGNDRNVEKHIYSEDGLKYTQDG